MAMSNYLKNAIINATLRNTQYTSPATVYLAAYTSNPTAADTGTEVSGGGYARQAITFGAPSNGVASNSARVEFPVATSSWGTVTHIGIRDQLTGGNLLYFGELTEAKLVDVDNILIFNIGQITETIV